MFANSNTPIFLQMAGNAKYPIDMRAEFVINEDGVQTYTMIVHDEEFSENEDGEDTFTCTLNKYAKIVENGYDVSLKI